jgi:tetratricopeptide (TPR) repeat protein
LQACRGRGGRVRVRRCAGGSAHDHNPLPEAATGLHPGLGDFHFAITTSVPEAQVYFDQGMALLYGFNHDEAARYFRRAAQLDPKAPMPWWGLALSIGPNYNDTFVDGHRARATYEAVQKARSLAAGATERERDYIEAIAKRYASPDPDSDWMKFHVDYSEAMKAMVEKYPDDLDAATMYAESIMMLRPWQLWTLDGEPAPGTLELVAVLESILKRDPNHPGANHFYIHAVEASPNLERAIPSAMRLMDLMPGAGHLVHMPGHIFLQTGDYDLAAETNVKAAAADKAFVDRTGATGMYPLMYWTHNLHFVAYARMQQGRYDEARQAALEIVKIIGEEDRKMQMAEGFLLYPLMIDLRFHKWDGILATPAPRKDRRLVYAFWRYARAMAYAAKGRVREAIAEQKQFRKAYAQVTPELQYLINNRATPVLDLAAATLDAELAWAKGDREAAIGHWRRAVDLESQLQYDEPPPWFYAVRQSLAAALLRNGQAEEAEVEFRRTLEKRPRDGRLLFGLWQSLKAQGRDNEAALVEKQFRVAWKEATTELRVEDL